jgi:hypothetical protein
MAGCMPQSVMRYLREKPAMKPDSAALIKTEKKFGLKDDRFIICSQCGHKITSPRHIISVNDHHRHTCINPAGVTYQIGCFSSAEGCMSYGELLMEHTWFTGFSWNYALCSHCGVHLGWYYQNENDSFYGLILDLLVDAATSH